MTVVKVTQRATGDKTRNVIIQAAKELFIEFGFSGTSLNQIANKAGINKSLILHHFKTKENLWKVVKASFLETIPEYQLLPPEDNLQDFVRCIITQRFALYDKNPDMARMISWQRLENTTANLEGMGNLGFQKFITAIEKFQAQGQVRKELDPEVISLWIAVNISGIFLVKDKPFQNKKQKQMYLDLITQSVLSTISPS